jgi:hypothetical protein
MLIKSLVKRLPTEERNLIRDGGFYASALIGAFGYFHYRMYISKNWMRSDGHYKFNQTITNCTPWQQMYFTWWRMPEEEWTVYHKFKPYFVLGQLDLSKEILIPKTKEVNGMKVHGFDVINPLYCYESGRLSFKALFAKSPDLITLSRAAIILHRGWIPATFRDKRSRPTELNSRELVRVTGVWRAGKTIHDYKVPNDPNANEWNNMCLEDIGLFWDLSNFDEAKWYYFQAVNCDAEGAIP